MNERYHEFCTWNNGNCHDSTACEECLRQEVLDAIAEERDRQVLDKGYTAEHDDQHTNNELALAAMSFAAPFDSATTLELLWPVNWDQAHFKRDKHSRRRQLVIAGAFIVAELERLERSEVMDAIAEDAKERI